MIKSSNSETGIQIFGEFFEFLRQNGFSIGVSEYLYLETILNEVSFKCSKQTLKNLICPLVASSKEQQLQFYRFFDQYFALVDDEYFASNGKSIEKLQLLENDETKDSEFVSVTPRQPKKSIYIIAALLLCLLIFFLITLFIYYKNSDPTAVVVAPPPLENSNVTLTPTVTPTVTPKPPPPLTTELLSEFFQLLVITSVLIVFSAYALYLFDKRRQVIGQQKETKPPFSFQIETKSPAPSLYRSEDFYYAAQRLRKRQDEEFERLDIPATIRATIRSLGFPEFRYKPESKPFEYFVLIERLSFSDHQALLFDEMVKALKNEGLYVSRYFYDADPRFCRDEQNKYYLLSELQHKYAEHRLLIFGDGQKFVDPETGELAEWTSLFSHWKDRSLHTPESPLNWGRREMTLASQFALFPATTEGLVELALHYENSSTDNPDNWQRHNFIPPALPDVSDEATSEELRAGLGDEVFNWICACAVNPELNWQLTLRLGMLKILGENLLAEENIFSMVRLRWFREGSLAPELRVNLIKELEKDKSKALLVRKTVVEILSEKAPPKNSFAYNTYQLFLAVQNWLLDSENAGKLNDLKLVLKRLPPDEALQDQTIVPALQSARHSFFDRLIPVSFRKLIYRFGIPNLGFRKAFLTVFLLFIALIGWFAVPALVDSYRQQARELSLLILPPLYREDISNSPDTDDFLNPNSTNTEELASSDNNFNSNTNSTNNSNSVVNANRSINSNYSSNTKLAANAGSVTVTNASFNTNLSSGNTLTNTVNSSGNANLTVNNNSIPVSPTSSPVLNARDAILSSNGSQFLTISKTSVRLWLIGTGRLIKEFSVLNDCCLATATFSDDGKTINASTTQGNKYKIYVSSGEVVRDTTASDTSIPTGQIIIGEIVKDKISVRLDSSPSGCRILYATKRDASFENYSQAPQLTPTELLLSPGIYIFIFEKDGQRSSPQAINVRPVPTRN